MKLALTVVTLSLLLVCAGCQSKPQPASAKPGQPDPNKQHWDGTTDVLKSYRFPSSSKGAQKANDFTFQDKSVSKTKPKEDTPQK